jgi:PAS domain S-box-containing protein
METISRALKPSSQTAPRARPEVENMELLQLLIETVADYSIIMLDPSGNVLSWNPTAERLKGWKAEEIVGQHFSRFYPPEDVQRGKTDMELRVAAEQGRFEDEGWRVRKDGTRFWANVVITALRDAQGQVRAFGKVTRDMTERRAAEEKIRKQTQELLDMATVPVVQVWDGIVLVPLIGTLDSQRTQQLMDRVLNRVMETSSPVAILDITGVPAIDTQTAQHLIEAVSAVRLLGSDVVLTGVRPVIAQTLVHLGIDLTNITTRASLAAGLRLALDILELRIVPKVAAA